MIYFIISNLYCDVLRSQKLFPWRGCRRERQWDVFSNLNLKVSVFSQQYTQFLQTADKHNSNWNQSLFFCLTGDIPWWKLARCGLLFLSCVSQAATIFLAIYGMCCLLMDAMVGRSPFCSYREEMCLSSTTPPLMALQYLDLSAVQIYNYSIVCFLTDRLIKC